MSGSRYFVISSHALRGVSLMDRWQRTARCGQLEHSDSGAALLVGPNLCGARGMYSKILKALWHLPPPEKLAQTLLWSMSGRGLYSTVPLCSSRLAVS